MMVSDTLSVSNGGAVDRDRSATTHPSKTSSHNDQELSLTVSLPGQKESIVSDPTDGLSSSHARSDEACVAEYQEPSPPERLHVEPEPAPVI